MRYIFVIFALWCCSISSWAQTDSTQVRKPMYSVRHDYTTESEQNSISPKSLDKTAKDYNPNSQKLFGWNNDIGVGLGYSYIHTPLSGDYFVGLAPQSVIAIDLWLWGVYLNIEGMRHKTGYDVYGFDESVGVLIFKVGPLFRTDLGKIKLSYGPYIGGIFANVRDSSHNSIGARTYYGDHASGFVAGARVGLRTKHFVASIHGSNREVGATIGFAFDPNLW